MVGEYVALPQLVVVGDQSSGKSSVLEGSAKLPFPRDSGLCTRFATQITFRRVPRTNVSVSIIPSANPSSEHAEAMRNRTKTDLQGLDLGTSALIMEEVRFTNEEDMMFAYSKHRCGQRGALRLGPLFRMTY